MLDVPAHFEGLFYFTPKHIGKNRTMAPSSLTYYVGINKKINNLLRHTLFFDPDLKDMPTRSTIIHSDHRRRNFMFSVRPKPTTTVAPVGHENIFILIPVVSELHDSENIR
jgi:phytoene desaturase